MSHSTPSPCIGVCAIDAVAGVCVGCQRSGDEIAAWPRASLAEKQAILDRVYARRAGAASVSAESTAWSPST